MMKRKTGLLSAILLAALLPFCGGKSETSGSSESHFLEPCGAGCKGGFDCICGVCTQPCTAGTACGDLGVASAVCTAGCEESACDVLCDGDADCEALGEDFACSGGRCRVAEVDGPGTCQERLIAIDSRLTSIIEAASRNCSVDDDCVQVDPSAACYERCPIAVSLSGRSVVQDHVAQLDAELCATHTENGCDVVGVDCEGSGAIACVDGQCVKDPSLPEPPCGDGTCDSSEGAATCPEDCGFCGDGQCSVLEDQWTCPNDCTSLCGNGSCDSGEDEASCANDCGPCGDGTCEGAEWYGNCAADCTCGDGTCAVDEVSCPEDCGICGDAYCDRLEIEGSCSTDCGFCGDGQCSASEDQWSCPNDCGWCGDGTCDSGETAATCPADCTPG